MVVLKKISGLFEYKGYFKIWINKKDIIKFIRIVFKNQKNIVLELGSEMKCLHEPYFYIIPKDHKKKMKISKTMKFRNIDELVKFLKQLFNQFGVKGFIAKSDKIKLKLCDDFSIEILVVGDENIGDFKVFLSRILTGKPTRYWKKIWEEKWKKNFPIEGIYKTYKNGLIYVYCDPVDLPLVIVEVLKRLRIGKCVVDLSGPGVLEISHPYVLEVQQKHGVNVTDEWLNKRFRKFDAQFSNYKAKLRVDKLYDFLTFGEVPLSDIVIYTSKLGMIHDHHGIAIIYSKSRYRKKLIKILNEILTGKPTKTWKKMFKAYEKQKGKNYLPFFMVFEEKEKKE